MCLLFADFCLFTDLLFLFVDMSDCVWCFDGVLLVLICCRILLLVNLLVFKLFDVA